MLADAKSGRFDTIVCWKSDRLSRGMYPAAALMEVVEAHQIQLEAVMDAIDMKTFGLMAAIGKKSGQPHFFRPATEAERRDPSVMLYRHTLPEGGSVLVRRMTVASRAELITAFCVTCAESIGTHQVLCYQCNQAIGEVVGIDNTYKDIAIAA